jgi:hypothetical protein
MLIPEWAAQSVLQVGFSVAPSGLSNFLILTPSSRSHCTPQVRLGAGPKGRQLIGPTVRSGLRNYRK